MAPQEEKSKPLLYSPVDQEEPSLSEDGSEYYGSDRYLRTKSGFLKRFARPLAFHTLALLLYTGAFLIGWAALRSSYNNSLIGSYTPIQGAIHYKTHYFNISHAHELPPYFGKPSKAIDKAWHDLLNFANIRVTSEDLSHFPGREEQAVPLPGGGYLATLNVYHELHCIKRLYRYMYPEYYFPNLTQELQDDNRMHNEHCLDLLQQGVMCRADPTLLTMRWGHNQPIPLANWTVAHKCVDWKAFDGWAEQHHVDVFQKGLLVHPTLGPSYPEGHGSPVGVAHDS